MTYKMAFEFKDDLTASDFVNELDKLEVWRRAWSTKTRVLVIVEDKHKRTPVDLLAAQFGGKPQAEEWSDCG